MDLGATPSQREQLRIGIWRSVDRARSKSVRAQNSARVERVVQNVICSRTSPHATGRYSSAASCEGQAARCGGVLALNKTMPHPTSGVGVQRDQRPRRATFA